MKSLFELYTPKAKREKEWLAVHKVEKRPLAPGEKTDFTGDVKTYDRKNYGVKVGKDAAGEVCEEEELDELSKKTLGRYVKTSALDYGMATGDIAKETARTGKQWTTDKKLGKKPINRIQGIERATERLVKGNKKAIKEEQLDEKKVNNNYPETIDDEEDKDFRPYWVKKRKRQDTA